jgi:2-polyprenyl-6-methoxyphenol hydroxylase-like FAD-dependent oxidoreductase
MPPRVDADYDVVILGAGMAGLTLARQLLMYSNKKILLLDKWREIPPSRQKVGESSVQVQGYYLSKILDMEEYLLREHFLKYNLRFCWPTPGQPNTGYEHYSQSYTKLFSNICCYQLDRNKIEGELLQLNLQKGSFSFTPGIDNLEVVLSNTLAPHTVRFEVEGERVEVRAGWIVDATGRARFLARRMGLAKPSPIRHGSIFFWVEGLLNIERLTELSPVRSMLHKNRRKLGHTPAWLATNHFCGEGYWFWVTPLQGKTTLGLVYDQARVNEEEVSSPEQAISWICRRHPLFARDLPKLKIVDHGMCRDFSYDCRQTISSERWAMAGEAGRSADLLYNPGGDLLSLNNTLITDAIVTPDSQTLTIKARLYELLMSGLYEAYVPSYALSYEVLGDHECFVLKYCWELTIYSSFYVFPFINQVFTETSFVVPYLDLFATVGVLNHSVQRFVTAYYRWKQNQAAEAREPVLFDFTELEPLRKSEELFYKVGLSARESVKTLRHSLTNVENLARFIAVYIYSVVLGDDELLTNKQLIESVKIECLTFDAEAMWRECRSLSSARDTSVLKLGLEFVRQFRKPAQRNRGSSKADSSAVSIETSAKFAAPS